MSTGIRGLAFVVLGATSAFASTPLASELPGASLALLQSQQGPVPRPPQGPPQSPPGGGTPEPATILLIAGGALGYGAMRWRKRKSGRSSES